MTRRYPHLGNPKRAGSREGRDHRLPPRFPGPFLFFSFPCRFLGPHPGNRAGMQQRRNLPFGNRTNELARRVGKFEGLDGIAGPLSRWVGRAVADPKVKDFLSGTWLGHPLHPPLTDLPIGFWTSAVALDLFGGKKSRRAAQRLVALGILSAVPAAVTGETDWSDTEGEDKRVGVMHAALNTAALLTFTSSWRARHRGRHLRGVALGIVGSGIATAAA